MFYHHEINLSCLIFIKSLFYFEKKIVLPFYTSYSDDAGFKIIIFSFAGKSGHLEWNSIAHHTEQKYFSINTIYLLHLF